jgi:zinc/manganese transport system permease protein
LVSFVFIALPSLGWTPSCFVGQESGLWGPPPSAGFLIWSERHLAAFQEAVIGVVFVVAASAEILLLSFNPHGAENLKDLLVGQILWVVPEQLIPVAILYAVVLAIWAIADLGRRRVLFYALFAVTVTASVQLVGVFLVFASLIVPTLAARIVVTSRPLLFGYGLGLGGYVLGLLASAFLDLPTGAAVVCSLALLALIAGCFMPRALPPAG